MDNKDFITVSLNLKSERIRSLKTVHKNGRLYIYISLIPEYPDCEYCGGKVKIKEYKTVTINHLPFAGMPSTIIWKRTRYICKDCAKTFSEANPFGFDGFHQSYAVLDNIARSLHNINLTFRQIADMHNVSSTIIEAYADSFIRVPRMSLPENLGIDEIHSHMAKYGGAYLCVFVDNKNRTLNELLCDRSKRTLFRYFDKIPLSERSKVKYVTIDMWQPYKDTVLKYLPNAKIAVDPFHVIKHLTDSFESLRIMIMKRVALYSPSYYLLKHWRKLLLSDYELDNEPKYNGYFKCKLNYRDIFNMLLDISPQLKEAYYLKELYRYFNKNCNYEKAEEELSDIISEFERRDPGCYEDFIEMLKNWKDEIINSFERPYSDRKQSNALAESINQKLRILIDVSNGYANFERFRARAIYCLNDMIFYSLSGRLSHSNKRKGKLRGTYNKTNSNNS